MAPRVKNATPPVEISDLPNEAGDEGEDIVVEEAGDAAASDDDVGSESAEELRRQLAVQKRRTEEAEAARDRMAAERSKDQKVLTDSRLLVIESTIKTKETEKEEILRRIEAAKEAGDYKAETIAIDQLTQVNGDLKSATLGKERLEHEIEQATAAQQEDPFEQMTRGFSPRAKSWAQSHREYFSADEEKNKQLVRAHHAALAQGVWAESDEYFQLVEENLSGAAPDDRPEPVRAAPRQAPAAPVSRQLNGGSREVATGIYEIGKDRYRVSAEVREAAAMSGIPLKEYIEQAKRLKRGSDGQLH